MGNLISGAGPDFHASPAEVAWITGIGGGVFTGLGAAFRGIYLRPHSPHDRVRRGWASGRAVRSLDGAGPRDSIHLWSRICGVLRSQHRIRICRFHGVWCWTFSGESITEPPRSYSLLVASGNLPVVYMTWLDGVGYKHAGARGLMGVDAVANGGTGLLLLAVAVYCAGRRRLRGKQ